MTDPDDKNVRRLGKRDQKKRLPKAGTLFPADEPDSQPAAGPLDLDQLSLLDADAEALQALASLQDEFRAPKITPDSERYPPLAPADHPEQHHIHKPATVQPAHAHPKRGGSIFYNLITVLAALGTIAAVAWITLIWVDPQTVLNPFPPATPFIQITATPGGPAQIVATPDESGQIFIVITDTPQAVTQSPYPFVVRDQVLYIPNSNDFGCNWWSIAGTVTDSSGQALNGYRVRITGEGIRETVFSGAAMTFGPGGYELPLIGTPQAAEFTVQLFSEQEVALSEPVSLITRADCEGNVTILNFVQNR